MFPPGTIFERFPYLLPNLVCTSIVSIGVVIGILFLEETHAEKKYRHDPGIEAGKWIISKICGCASSKSSGCEKAVDMSEETPLINEDERLPSYQSAKATASSVHQGDVDVDAIAIAAREIRKPAVSKAFTRQVVLNIVGYGILA